MSRLGTKSKVGDSGLSVAVGAVMRTNRDG
jgi:hypothetical protein